jgi:hypothetical protein
METQLRRGDAFQLGYLPRLVRAPFDALAILEEARGSDPATLDAMLRALPARGPEIVSCVWQLESVVGGRLRVEPPRPPRTAEEFALWSRAVARAFDSSPFAVDEGRRAAYHLGMRVGAAETLLVGAARVWTLWSAVPGHEALSARAASMRGEINALSSSVKTDCETSRAEDAALTRELAMAAQAMAGVPSEAASAALAAIRTRIGFVARALEAAA